MPASSIESRLHPIIYVRGFAGTENEIEDTVSDPYMGFNLGATKFKQHHEGTVRRHYFESPLARLVKDFDYRDVYTSASSTARKAQRSSANMTNSLGTTTSRNGCQSFARFS